MGWMQRIFGDKCFGDSNAYKVSDRYNHSVNKMDRLLVLYSGCTYHILYNTYGNVQSIYM